MVAHAEIDLGQRSGAEPGGHVDDQAHVHAVARNEGQLFQDRPAPGVLAGERLLERGQLGEEQ